MLCRDYNECFVRAQSVNNATRAHGKIKDSYLFIFVATEKPLHFFNVYDLDDYRGTHARGKRDISSPESFIDSLDLDPNDEPSEEVGVISCILLHPLHPISS